MIILFYILSVWIGFLLAIFTISIIEKTDPITAFLMFWEKVFK